MAGLRLEHGCSRNSVCVLNYYGILISKGNLGIPFPSTKPSKIPNFLITEVTHCPGSSHFLCVLMTCPPTVSLRGLIDIKEGLFNNTKEPQLRKPRK